MRMAPSPADLPPNYECVKGTPVGSFDGVDAQPDTLTRCEFDSRTLHPQRGLRRRKNGDTLVWYQAVRHRGLLIRAALGIFLL